MKLYNTLLRQAEEFKPLEDNNVRMYSCGPTVYDHIHIGNLSAFIIADTLRRALRASGYNVTHIMNFTDVDDKTIRRSHEQYPELEPREALKKLTEHYGDIFLKDMALVGNDVPAYTFVKATDEKVIEGMQQLIHELYGGGFAYIADDGVYFSIEAYKKSGKTYGQLSEITSSSTSEARIANDEYDKESAHDFALWKVQKEGEPSWEFELDGHELDGRPGWHIECSVMSSQNLGQPFDIHTGGIDLIFPHHENEIAQSTAGKEDPLYAACFVHNEHILVDGKKMSKSLNNFYTLQDIIDKGYDPLAFRLLVLQSHYRSQAHFSWENLEAAQNRLRDIYAWADLRHQTTLGSMPDELDQLFRTTREDILTAFGDDLNTSAALTALGKLMNHMTNIELPGVDGKYSDGTLAFLENAFGLPLSNRPDITSEQKQIIGAREEARQNQDWAKSDELRNQLAGQGIGLRDTEHGAIWYRL